MYRSCIACLLAGSIGTHWRHASRRPAELQAGLGNQGGPILRDAAANRRAEMDRRRIGRCVALHDDCRIFRDRVLAAKGKRRRDRISRALSMVVARGESRGGFLGRRSRRALLDRQRSSVPLRQMTEVRPHTTNLQAVRTVHPFDHVRPTRGTSTDRTHRQFLLAAPRQRKTARCREWCGQRAGGCRLRSIMRNSKAGWRNDALRRGMPRSISEAPRGTSPSFRTSRSMKNDTDLGCYNATR